ncbi:MAG: ribonuclease HII [Winogradskyella sp.]|uniref:ribonuclease HII n=1 Tax=Winogradskyella sp. TaxID=1883156 RepID=UPI001835E877|nr:ribonuclease HII [Winogradskyella sp.]
MKRLLFLMVLVSLCTACKKDYSKIKEAHKFIPPSSTTVFKINDINDFLISVENHTILSSIYNKELKQTRSVLKHLNSTRPVYLSYLNSSDSDFVILTENDSTLFIVDSIQNHVSETLVDLKIEKTQIDSTVIYHKSVGNIFSASNKLELIKNLKVENPNSDLSQLIETTNEASLASVIFNTNAHRQSKLLFIDDQDTTNAPNLTVLDLKYTNQNLKYNGILTSKDSIPFKLDYFKNTIPQKINAIAIAPYNTKSLLSITFQDFSQFTKNKGLLGTKPIDSIQSFLNFTTEISLIDNALALYTLDAQLVLESIEQKDNVETFRGIEIYSFGLPNFFESRIAPFITYKDANYFTVYKNFILFSDTIETLKTILTDALNDHNLDTNEAYKNISESLSSESSLFIFKDAEVLSQLLGKNLKGYNANAVQYIYEDGYAHVNGIIQKFKKRKVSNNVIEAFSTGIEYDIISTPQPVKNHLTNTYDILIQDVNNSVYLISDSGNILWKKKINGKILGKVEQIDMFKNGRLQLVFNTSNRLYVIDRNGKDAPGFPLKFNDNITQPLAVFDYDNNRNYRLLVTQGKNLLMYNQKGQNVRGFKYSSNKANINTQPKHFRIGSKDYIAFTAGDEFKILDRQGNIRIDVKDKIHFSNNEIFLYQNKFTTTNTLGELVQVNTKGIVNTKNLNLPTNHKIEATSKTLVSMTENKLNIKSRTVDLDYGDYTAPRIFYLNDKIYVTTTDLQAKKVYLFDSQAKPIANFPVYGTSGAELQKLDSEKGLELITQGDSKTLLVYKL